MSQKRFYNFQDEEGREYNLPWKSIEPPPEYDEDGDVRILIGLARGWRGKMENGIYPFEIPRCYLMVLGIL